MRLLSFVLPLARRIARRLEPPPPAPEFSGRFTNFDEALSQSTGYDTSDIAQAIVGRVGPYLNGEAVELDDRFLHVHSALSFIANGSKRLSILDVGGGNGSYFYVIKRLMPDVDLEWSILETESLALACRESSPKDLWVTKWPDRRFDVVLFSGALQYLPLPHDSLQRACSLASWVIATRLPMADDECDWITIQRPNQAILPGTLPMWVFGEAMMQTISKIGSIAYSWTVGGDNASLATIGARSSGFLIRSRSVTHDIPHPSACSTQLR
jgi:putative methyltransferase (TIGR04325 family)